MTRKTVAEGMPVLLWRIPELDAASRAAAAAEEVDPGGSDSAASPIPPADGAAAPSLDEILERQAASGYAEGWQRGYAEGKDEGHASGLAAGTAAARAAVAAELRRLAAITEKLAAPITALDAAVEEAVAALALEVAREVIGSETSRSRDYLVGLIRQAVAKVPVEMGAVKIVLSPLDLELIRRSAPDLETDGALLIGDDGIEIGDCLVVADGQNTPVRDMRWRPRPGDAQADLSLATRWRAVMRTLFEEEDK